MVDGLNVGRRVVLDLKGGGGQIHGMVYALDVRAGLVAIQIGNESLRVVSLSSLDKVSEWTQGMNGGNKMMKNWDLKVANVDIQRMRGMEEKEWAKKHVEYVGIGVGVSKDAQKLFDALAKNFDCKWKEQVIIVEDVFSVSPPYQTVEKLVPVVDNPRLEERVKLIVDTLRKRMKQASSVPDQAKAQQPPKAQQPKVRLPSPPPPSSSSQPASSVNTNWRTTSKPRTTNVSK